MIRGVDAPYRRRVHRIAHELVALALKPRHRVHAVGEDDSHKWWEWIEDHGEIIFPLLALAVIALIVFGVRRGMMTSSADLEQKQAEKDAIVRMMRQKLLVSPEAVGAELQIDRFRAAALLEELEREGKLVQQRIAGGVAHYRLKGL